MRWVSSEGGPVLLIAVRWWWPDRWSPRGAPPAAEGRGPRRDLPDLPVTPTSSATVRVVHLRREQNPATQDPLIGAPAD